MAPETENRNKFLAKVFLVTLSAAIGVVLIAGGIGAFRNEGSVFTFFVMILFVSLGVGLLRTAWKLMGE